MHTAWLTSPYLFSKLVSAFFIIIVNFRQNIPIEMQTKRQQKHKHQQKR